MKAHFVFVALFVIAGVATGFLLVPRDKELALMFFKDKDFEAALQVYEDQLAAGDWSINVVVPLTQLYLQYGDVDTAAGLMEKFVRRNPENIEARRLLGRYFQFAQRPADYLRNLEETIDISISETELRELSAIYNFNAQFERQVAVLEMLIRHFPSNSGDFLTLAQLQASLSDFDGAVRTLDRLLELHPDTLTADVTELHLSLALDRKRYDEAYAQAKGWLSRHPVPETFSRFASLFAFKGRGDLGLKLIDPIMADIEKYPDLLAEYVRLQAENGQAKAAFERLRRMHLAGMLPDEAAGTFIDLALDRDEKDMALKSAGEIDLRILPDWMLPVLAEVSISIDRFDFVQGMLDGLGTGFLELRPVLAAEVSLVLNDVPAARHWVGVAESAPVLTTTQRINLARVYLDLDEDTNALSILRDVAYEPAAPARIFSDLARLFVRLDRTKEGLSVFGDILETRDEYLIEAGWALLATSAGDASAVIAWMDGNTEDAQRQALLDVYFAAARHNRPLLALIAAEHVFARTSRPSDRNRFARALTDVAMPGGPLEDVQSAVLGIYAEHAITGDAARISDLGYADLAEQFVSAMMASLPESKDIETSKSESEDDDAGSADLKELRREFDTRGGRLAYVVGAIQRLDIGKAPGRFLAEHNAERLGLGYFEKDAFEIALSEIVQWQAYDLAWPYVEERAAGQLNEWFYTLVEFARRATLKNDVVVFLKRELDRRDLSRKVHEARLNALVEVSGLPEALPYFETFANLYGIEWAYSNVDSLKSLARGDDVPTFWLEFAKGPQGTAEIKRVAVFNLLEHGRKDDAVDLLLDLAKDAPPDSPDVVQLLYLWGPRPTTSEMNWIESRAMTAAADDMRKWFGILFERGGAERILVLGQAVMARSPDDAERTALAPVYLRAVIEKGDRPLGKELLAEFLGATTSTDHVLEYADLAFANGFVDLAQIGYGRLARESEPTNHVLQRHALSAYFNDDRQVAMTAYKRYLTATGNQSTPESNYYYGELLNGAGRTAQALKYFRAALNGSDGWTAPSPEQKFIRARLMQLTGRIEAAKDAYRQILADRPDQDGVRAELVALLLQGGELDEARLVMTGREETN